MTTKIQKFIPIAKRDTAQKITVGVVYAPNVADTQGDRAVPALIATAAHAFNASGKSDHVDREHDLKKTGARIVESYLAKAGDPDGYPEGAWVVSVKHTDATWADVAAGKINGYSLYGNGARVAAKNEKGVFDLTALNVTAISLVNRPANRTQVDPATFVRKSELPSDAPQWAKDLAAQNAALLAQIDQLKGGVTVGKSSGSPTTDIRKAVQAEHDARRDVQIAELRKSRSNLHAQLEELWGAEGAAMFTPQIRRAREAELCIELDKADRELARLGADGIDWARHDGFSSSRFGGSGTSEVLHVEKMWPNDDSAYALPKSRRSKPGDGNPIDTLKV